MVDDVPGSLNHPSQRPEVRPEDGLPPRRRSKGRVPAPTHERSASRSKTGVLPAGGLLGRFERIGALSAGPTQARSIFLLPEPDRLNRLALVVALGSALTGLTLLASTTPH